MYLSETQAFWLQWHYEELARTRESLARDIEEISVNIPHSAEERAAQQSTQDRLLSRYNRLNDVFGLPKVDLAKQLEDDLQAAQTGKMPEWMKRPHG